MNATVKKLFAAVLITTTCLFAAGCGSSSNSGASGDKKEIKMGVTAGPHAEVMEEVTKEAAKQGITIKVVEFNDYVQPNKALAEGDLHAASAVHGQRRQETRPEDHLHRQDHYPAHGRLLP